MSLSIKKCLLAGFMMFGTLLTPVLSRADSDYHPTNDGGNFGIGLELGEPGTWGATGKIWIDRANAFQPAVKFTSTNDALLQLDYLWHNFDIIHMKDTDGEMPLYIGLGGDLLLQSSVQIAGRIPVGISYIFNKKNVPVDIYLQAVPTLWFFSGGLTTFDVYGELGAHYYF